MLKVTGKSWKKSCPKLGQKAFSTICLPPPSNLLAEKIVRVSDFTKSRLLLINYGLVCSLKTDINPLRIISFSNSLCELRPPPSRPFLESVPLPSHVHFTMSKWNVGWGAIWISWVCLAYFYHPHLMYIIMYVYCIKNTRTTYRYIFH